ncbi:MAG: hypothetical protein QW683_08740 [Candidatus Caldarchaeum sp.]
MNSLEREIRTRLEELFPPAKSLQDLPPTKLGEVLSLKVAIEAGVFCIRVNRKWAEIQAYFSLESPAEDCFFSLNGKEAVGFLKRPRIPQDGETGELPFLGRTGEFEGDLQIGNLWGVLSAFGDLKSIVFTDQFSPSELGIFAITHKGLGFKALVTNRNLGLNGVEMDQVEKALSLPVGNLLWALKPREVNGSLPYQTRIQPTWDDHFAFPKGIRVWQLNPASNWFLGVNLFAKEPSEGEKVELA